jgi:hypothetical protein
VILKRNGPSTCAIFIPYITSTALFPISKVAINKGGLLVKMLTILEENSPCFLSSSILNRLALINAISIPEKKAERTRQIIIIIPKGIAIGCSNLNFSCDFF